MHVRPIRDTHPLCSSHAKALYSDLGGAQNAHVWRYVDSGPFYDLESFSEFVKSLIEGGGFCILKYDSTHPSSQTHLADEDEVRGTPIGIICPSSGITANRSIEIGVILSSLLQRTTAATEAIYLLIKHCFDDLGYRRVEWKTNNLNEPSKRAAVRLGFVPEGVFRKHMIVKGRSRDTAWFSVTDDDWVGSVKAALEEWLEKKNFDEGGRQVRKLEEVRMGIADKKN